MDGKLYHSPKKKALRVELMTTLFISDLHLQPNKPIITKRFFELLEIIPKSVKNLYILGDLFEAWIGDDDNRPFNQEIIQRLCTTAKDGVTIYFMAGNRDFLIGEQFANQAKLILLSDPTVADLNGKPVLLMHGDSLCTDDKAFMDYLQRVRSEKFRTAILQKPLWLRRTVAYLLRFGSRVHHAFCRNKDIMDVNQDTVRSIMEKYHVNTLIHGHTHRPKTHSMTVNTIPATRYVLGDWGEQGNFLLCKENEAPFLHYFSNQTEIQTILSNS